jgi:hypothetical protein
VKSDGMLGELEIFAKKSGGAPDYGAILMEIQKVAQSGLPLRSAAGKHQVLRDIIKLARRTGL